MKKYFLAFEISKSLQEKIVEEFLCFDSHQIQGIEWILPESYHITLQYFEDHKSHKFSENIPKFLETLQHIINETPLAFSSFLLSTAEVKVRERKYNDSTKNFISVKIKAPYATRAHWGSALCNALLFSKNEKLIIDEWFLSWTPHITVGYFENQTASENFREVLKENSLQNTDFMKGILTYEFEIKKVSLFEVMFGFKKGQSYYDVIESFELPIP